MAEEIYRDCTGYEGLWSVWAEEAGRVAGRSEDGDAATLIRSPKLELGEISQDGELEKNPVGRDRKLPTIRSQCRLD